MKLRQMAKKYFVPAVVASAGMVASSAFAIDSADITAAISNGSTVVAAVVAGVITIAALAFGLNMVKGLISN